MCTGLPPHTYNGKDCEPCKRLNRRRQREYCQREYCQRELAIAWSELMASVQELVGVLAHSIEEFFTEKF